MAKVLKTIIIGLAVILVLWFSLDIQNLDDHRAAVSPAKFNATDFAAQFWAESLPSCIAEAPQMEDVLIMLNQNPEKAFEIYGKKLGISTTGYFMVKGQGQIEKVEEEFVLLSLDENTKIKLATDFIYGNAVRDGSGKVDINDFLNMTDFNAVSVAINKLVKEEVVSRLRRFSAVGKWLEYTGAFEINEENIDFSDILLLPVSVNISDGKSE